MIDDRQGRGRTHRNVFGIVLEQPIGGCRAASTKKNSFFPKMVKNCQFVAKNGVFLAGVVSCRAPYPIFRVPDPVKFVYDWIGAPYWVLQGRQHKKKFSSKNGQQLPAFG